MRPVLRNGLSPWFLYLVLCCLSWIASGGARGADSPLRLASFNIQIFGQAKMKKAAAVSTLLRILDRYDLVFIMEIRDSEDSAIYELLDRLNKESQKNYQIVVSERLGRTFSKEQYAFLFNPDKVYPDHAYVWKDSGDKFEREPFVAHFRAGREEFSMIGLHAAPSDVTAELKALPPVYAEAKQKFGSQNIFVVGDLNADCNYYNPKGGFDFFADRVTALVPEGEDTTVANTNCTYDRVLAFGNLPRASSVAESFNFHTAYGLSRSAAEDVSDHYPVEWTLDFEQDSGNGPVGEPVITTPVSTVPENRCGTNPTPTPRGYCYAEFESGRRRVANACCPL